MGGRPWALRSSRPSAQKWLCSAYDPLSVGNGNAVPGPDIRLVAEVYCSKRAP